MSPKPVTALRQRLLEDMAVRHFGETAPADDLRNFQVHLNENGVRPCSFNSARPRRNHSPAFKAKVALAAV
jgi:hypothetical protein